LEVTQHTWKLQLREISSFVSNVSYVLFSIVKIK